MAIKRKSKVIQATENNSGTVESFIGLYIKKEDKRKKNRKTQQNKQTSKIALPAALLTARYNFFGELWLMKATTWTKRGVLSAVQLDRSQKESAAQSR